VTGGVAAGLRARTWAWGAELDELGAWPRDRSSPGGARPAPAPGRPGEVPHGIIRREGRGWLLALDDRQVLVNDLIGMSYLATLLTSPGQPLSAVALATGDPDAGDSARHEVVDAEARSAYEARIRDLVVGFGLRARFGSQPRFGVGCGNGFARELRIAVGIVGVALTTAHRLRRSCQACARA
jgi:hypothetical protein